MRKVLKKLVAPVLKFSPRGLTNYPAFWRDFLKYKKMSGAEKTKLANIFPVLDEKTPTTGIDPHYFYQAIWAFEKILKNRPQEHVDIGSQTNLVGLLTTIAKVKFVDIRPLDTELPNLENIKFI